MAAVTRLGLYGGARSPYGSFAGKEEAVDKPQTGMLFRGRRATAQYDEWIRSGAPRVIAAKKRERPRKITKKLRIAPTEEFLSFEVPVYDRDWFSTLPELLPQTIIPVEFYEEYAIALAQAHYEVFLRAEDEMLLVMIGGSG